MHEVLLFGGVPASAQSHVLSVIAGIAACRPQSLIEHHLIFKPIRQPGTITARAQAKPGSQNQSLQSQLSNDLYYLQLVGQLHRQRTAGTEQDLEDRENEDPMKLDDSMTLDEQEQSPSLQQAVNGSKTETSGFQPAIEKTPAADSSIDFTVNPWTIEFRDLPDVPGKRAALSRLMASIPVVDGSPLDLIKTIGYVYSTAYVLKGWQIVHGNIIVHLHKSFLAPKAGKSADVELPRVSINSIDTLKPFDSSGGYFLQAAIRVQDGSKPELIQQAVSELASFKEAMRGVVDLEVGDRLALDTRVR